MAHASTSMPCMKNPTKRLRQVVTDVDDARTVLQDDVAFVSPFLDGKMLDFDVSCMGGRPILVDHGNCGLIVDEKRRRTRTDCFQLQ